VTERGAGRLAGALARRSGQRGPAGGGRPAPAQARLGQRRRNRKKTGKSSNPDYKQALGYVRRVVHQQVINQALRDPEVQRALLRELREWGVEHKEGEAAYSDLLELLLLEWLESVGYGVDGGR
jgi:hypothetical protein